MVYTKILLDVIRKIVYDISIILISAYLLNKEEKAIELFCESTASSLIQHSEFFQAFDEHKTSIGKTRIFNNT